MAINTPMETQPCTRCDGSGRYSWNMRDGDRCWGCGGKGVNYTTRANIALDLFRDLRQQPLESFKLGDLVRSRISGTERTYQLAAKHEFSGVSHYGKHEDGSTNYDEIIPNPGVTLSYGKPADRKGAGLSYAPDNPPTFGVVVSDELHAHAVELLVEYQNLLTKKGTVRKDSTERAEVVKNEIAQIFSAPENRFNMPVVLPVS